MCTSENKGTPKKAADKGYIRKDHGLVGDAHADCCTHRQVSLLAMESIEKMRGLGLAVGPGNFGENLTTEGIDLVSLPIGAAISIGPSVILQVTQIGKECHSPCAIYRQAGTCVMPTEGIFARVIRGGIIKVDDKLSGGINDERDKEDKRLTDHR